jgi:hypothetical protein
MKDTESRMENGPQLTPVIPALAGLYPLAPPSLPTGILQFTATNTHPETRPFASPLAQSVV